MPVVICECCWACSVEHVAFVLDVSKACAAALLEAHAWNEHATVDAYFSNPAGAARIVWDACVLLHPCHMSMFADQTSACA